MRPYEHLGMTHSLPVFLLAGGAGTRIASMYAGTPKCLIDIHGKPFLSYVLENIKRFGFNRVVILAGHLSQPIIDYAGDGASFGLNIQYSLDGAQLLGTGGAIRKALPFAEDDFVVSYADSYLDYDWSPIVDHYFRSGSQSLVSIYKNDDATDKSNIIFKDGKIVSYCKKNQTPDHNYIDWGVSVFSKKTFTQCPENSWDLSNYLLDRIAQNALDGFAVPQKYFEIGTPHALEAFRRHMKDRPGK